MFFYIQKAIICGIMYNSHLFYEFSLTEMQSGGKDYFRICRERYWKKENLFIKTDSP